MTKINKHSINKYINQLFVSLNRVAILECLVSYREWNPKNSIEVSDLQSFFCCPETTLLKWLRTSLKIMRSFATSEMIKYCMPTEKPHSFWRLNVLVAITFLIAFWNVRFFISYPIENESSKLTNSLTNRKESSHRERDKRTPSLLLTIRSFITKLLNSFKRICGRTFKSMI